MNSNNKKFPFIITVEWHEQEDCSYKVHRREELGNPLYPVGDGLTQQEAIEDLLQKEYRMGNPFYTPYQYDEY